MNLRRARVVGRSYAAGAHLLTHICTVGACGKKNRHGPLAALPGAGVWRRAWGDGAHCHPPARHALDDDAEIRWARFNIFSDGSSRLYSAAPDGGLAVTIQHHQIPEFNVQLSQVKLILYPKQRAKPAASRTRTCTNAAVFIASGECPIRF